MFWDSSALVPLIFPEARSAEIASLAARGDLVIWWGTPVECHAAAQRSLRERRVTPAEVRAGLRRLHEIVLHTTTVVPSDALRTRAEHVTAVHPLRAADALQLAAALVWCEEEPWHESFVSLDNRLRSAARQEGFTIEPDDQPSGR